MAVPASKAEMIKFFKSKNSTYDAIEEIIGKLLEVPGLTLQTIGNDKFIVNEAAGRAIYAQGVVYKEQCKNIIKLYCVQKWFNIILFQLPKIVFTS